MLVVGQSEVVDDRQVPFRALEARLEPHADGPRGALVRIVATFVSGCRIVHRSEEYFHAAQPRGRWNSGSTAA